MEITLRPAFGTDANAVADVYLASREAFVSFAPLTHNDSEVRQYIAHILIPGGQVTVAVQEQKIVGMMTTSCGDCGGSIDHLYVAPEYTGAGIGTKLLAQAKSELGSPLRLYTFQENTGARRFYERHGFRAIVFSDGADNEEECLDVLYEWDASAGA